MWGPIVANVWFGIPFFAITLLAALQAIPRELYEAAAIDGASAWQRFTKVTLPFLAPMIAITVLLRTIWISNFADLIVVMTGGGPANATQILPSYIFTTAYRKLDFGYASAIATALLLLLLLYALVLIRMRRAPPEHDMSRASAPARQGCWLLRSATARRSRSICCSRCSRCTGWSRSRSRRTGCCTPRASGCGRPRRPGRTSSSSCCASDFPAFFTNSVIVSLGTAVAVTLVAAAAGYAFSRFRFRGK